MKESKKEIKLKALLISKDGINWLCVRQFYVSDLKTNEFLSNIYYQGESFKLVVKEDNQLLTENQIKRENQICQNQIKTQMKK